jgi:hypothetical protein
MHTGFAAGPVPLRPRSSSFWTLCIRIHSGWFSVFIFFLLFMTLEGCSMDSPRGAAHDAAVEEERRVFLEPAACGEEGDPHEAENSCLVCHRGIESIRCSESDMFKQIVARAEASGTRNRCVICHGGNATVFPEPGLDPKSEAYREFTRKAHSGTSLYLLSNPGPKTFYPDPGSPWINTNTCT